MLVLALAYGVSAAANLLLSVVVGRQLGAAALGQFALAVAVARVCYAATDFGSATHLTRVIARDRDRAGAETARFLIVRAAVVPIAMVLGAAIARGPGAAVAVALGAGTVQSIYEAALLALGRRRLVAALTAATATAVIVGCAAWWLAGGGLIGFAVGYAGAAALGLAVWAVRARPLVRLRRGFERASTLRALRTCWPIGASTVLAIAALRAPILVLGAFAAPRDVGTFVAIDTFVTAAGILQVAVSNTTFPRLAASFRTDRAAFRALLWRSNAVLAAIGVATAIGLGVWGSQISALVFAGRDFGRVRDLAPIIAWSAPALLVVHHNIYVFAAADSERRNLHVMLVWCAVVTGAQLALVPAYGVVGAAWGVLIGRGVGLGVLLVLLARFSARRPG